MEPWHGFGTPAAGRITASCSISGLGSRRGVGPGGTRASHAAEGGPDTSSIANRVALNEQESGRAEDCGFIAITSVEQLDGR